MPFLFDDIIKSYHKISQPVLQHALNVLKEHITEVLPTIFLGLCDSEKDVKELCRSVFDEIVTSTSTATRLYMAELMPAIIRTLDDQSWVLKKQGTCLTACIGGLNYVTCSFGANLQ